MYIREKTYTVKVVNDADVYQVDRNHNDMLLWDLSDDTMAIGHGHKGSVEDGSGYMDMMFDDVETFKTKFEAITAWAEGQR